MKILRMRTRPVIVTLVILGCIMALVLFTLMGQTPSTRPEVDLVYPGSVVLTKQDSSTGYELMLGSSASVHEILDFYLAEVESRGFRDGGSTARIPTTTETIACAWHDGDTILRLAFLDPKVLSRYTEVPTGYATLYRWSAFDETAPESNRPCSMLLEDVPRA